MAMASKSRRVLITTERQENAKMAKSKPMGSIPSQREPLGELGNNVNTVRGTTLVSKVSPRVGALRKPGVYPVLSKPIDKPNIVAQTVSEPPVAISTKPVIIKPAHVPVCAEQVILGSVKIDDSETVSFSSDLLVEDIDYEDGDNPLLVSIYTNDIYAHLRKLERETSINKNFLEGHRITPNMRSVLINWLVEVHQQFHLTQETLYVTAGVIDRFLQSCSSIDKKRLQLVGVTAMVIACKYEEICIPEIKDFVYMTDNAYTVAEILQMEKNILRILNFALGRPLPLQFLRRYSKAGKALGTHHTMAKYFLEQSLIHYQMCHIPPSLIAAAALYLSFTLFGIGNNAEEVKKSVWTPTLAHYTTYREDQVLPVVREMASMIIAAETSRHQAVRNKYMLPKHMKMSLRPELKSETILKLAAEERKD
ncbi:G2/mitotic-specific cyclin-B1 [Athalia rosae]|uniref:G2/mitotic-specific cyclin-B1 n=1 Tax=Athalia rosae TaxID=37344 RepID=UPI0020338499|nr:G2/mitotic-specific cyclin-B1 [Athalia rosae]